MSKKLTKEDVKGPDAFIAFSDKVIEKIEEQRKPIIFVLAAGFIVGLAFVSVSFIMKKQEQEAQNALYKLETQYKKRTDKLAKDEQKNKEGKSLESDYGQIVDQYQQFIKEYPKSKAAKIAAIALADIYQDYGKNEKSLETLENATKSLDPDDFFFGLILSKKASIYLDTKKYPDAISTLKTIIAEKSQEHLKADSLLRMGLAYQQMSKVDDAINTFETITRDFAKSDAARTAKSYIRLLKLKKGKG